MPKLIPLLLNVEEIAFGTVLLKIHDMPGVTDYTIPLGAGGEGAGRKRLEQAARAAPGNPSERTRAVVALLATGPKHIQEISQAIGGKRSRAYGVMTGLRKNGIAEGVGGAMWQLTAKARAHIADAPAALPAPAKKTPSGRALTGAGPILLREVLAAGPKPPGELRAELRAKGMRPNSINGVLMRAKRDGIVRNNGAGYALTAKGAKLNSEAVTHG